MKISFKIVPRFLQLSFFLLFALVLDFILFNFAAVCPTCSSFSQFLQTPTSLSGPLIVSLTALLTIKAKKA